MLTAPHPEPLAIAPPTACSNCGAGFDADRPRPRFCSACGQETNVAPPTLREFAQQFGGAYFSTEGALWRTLKLLLTQPGELTVQYLAGRRKHYVLPLRLYLTISLLTLLLIRTLGHVDLVSGLDGPELAAAEHGELPRILLNAQGHRVGVQDGVFVCERLPALVCELVHARAAPDARTFLRKLRLANERVQANLGAVMFVLLPAFALCLKLVNPQARMGYTAHLVFALHLHAFWFLVLALMPLLNGFGFAAIGVYTLLAGRRVYGGRWGPRLLRTGALTVMYVGLLAVTLPLTWLAALLA